MPAFEIPCPQCGQRLLVPDRSLLGTKVRCGKCGRKFVATAATGSFETPVEVSELAELRTKPAAQGPSAARTPAPRADMQRARKAPASPERHEPAPGPAPPGDAFAGLDFVPVIDADARLADRVTRRARSSRRNTLIAVAATIALLGGTMAWFVASQSRLPGKPVRSDTAPEAGAPDDTESNAPTVPGDRAATPARPLSLQLVPMGARVVLHLRPADLWRPGGTAEEFRGCLGPLATSLEERIRALCLCEPAEIEEVLFALIPTSREAFDTAVVVRTAQPIRKSELLDKIGGELIDRPLPHYVTATRTFLFHDAHTLAIAPRAMTESLLEAAAESAVTSQGIQALLPRTDRDRLFTLIAELEDVRNAAKTLVPSDMQNFLAALLDFAGDDAETIAWSFQPGDPTSERDLVSELLIRNASTRTAARLRNDVKGRLAALPGDILQLVQRMNPRQAGERQIIGRFPAMLKVVEQAAAFETDRRLVLIRWELPERAGPNLALGARLAWRETTRPDFGKSAAPASAPVSPPAAPETIAERLRKKIDVDFRDEFLYAAVEYIGEEIGVTFRLDGPGMKRVGTTQNEKQKLTAQQTSAAEILDRILTPRKLVLIVNETEKTATITSTEEAEARKWTPFSLQPAGGG